MILEPWKSPEQIDRRLADLTDSDFAELLRTTNPEIFGDPADSYTSPSAPYWKKRIAFVALAGLMAMSAGYGFVSTSRDHPQAAPKPHVAAIVPKHHSAATRAVHHAPVAVPHVAARHAAPVHAAVAAAPAAPSELLIRRARAQLLHERALAAQAETEARAQAARAHREAQLAMQARAQANAQALEEALAQARAQAKAEALAQARAQAVAAAQAQQLEQAQQQALLENASNGGVKPGAVPPAGGHMGTNPSPNNPSPVAWPEPNCTPHRGSLLLMLDHVRVGPTNAGSLLRLVHGP